MLLNNNFVQLIKYLYLVEIVYFFLSSQGFLKPLWSHFCPTLAWSCVEGRHLPCEHRAESPVHSYYQRSSSAKKGAMEMDGHHDSILLLLWFSGPQETVTHQAGAQLHGIHRQGHSAHRCLHSPSICAHSGWASNISSQPAGLLTKWLCNVRRFYLPISMCLCVLRHHMEAGFAEALEFHWKGNSSS